MEKILIVEDEEKIARVLQLELQHEGYEVNRAEDGRNGLEMASTGEYDLVLLDIMLPELNGLEVLRRLRAAEIDVPVILLTARDTVPDKVSGLNHGANDYVTKPFAVEELLARIRNLLRMFQQQKAQSEFITVDDLTVDIKGRKVTRGDQSIELTPKEFDLLLFLLRNKGHVLSREQIISEVWGYEFVGDTNVVDVYIRYLRQKIDKGFKQKLIQTSRGIGYFIAEPEQ